MTRVRRGGDSLAAIGGVPGPRWSPAMRPYDGRDGAPGGQR
ncbi:hypothetical protein GA0070609_1002 [Micromonospora echinaurantiaca]|uniref:Uncharacterized protein n=1 Tax=Micromonospora echinaurantiaca TaxID=47857 RepID=A0A1C5H5S0_9ACTN|nr:hypothetical protein GA0070609_1002 [Micromonospora echinaurantiaca]